MLLIQEGASQRSSEERELERVSRNPTDEHYLHRTGYSVESRGGKDERMQPKAVSVYSPAMTIFNSEEMALKDFRFSLLFLA